MIQNKFLSQSFQLNTKRSNPNKNHISSDHSYINNSSIVYLTFRKSDRYSITGLQTISPVGEISLIVSTHQLSKYIQQDDTIDESMLFQIKKVNSAKYQHLKYREQFYLVHKYSGLHLVCKQNLNQISLLEFSKDYSERGVFYCENNQQQNACQLYVSSQHNIKICNVYLKNKFLKVLTEHNIHKNTLAFCNEYSVFNMNVYRIDDSIPTLTKTSYVEIHLKQNHKKLRVIPCRSLLDSDFGLPYNKYCKPENFQLIIDDKIGTIWKVQIKNKRSNSNQAEIKYGQQISFKCTNTGLYLSYQLLNPGKLFLDNQSSKSSNIFKIDKLINKMSESTGNQDNCIWFNCPVEMNGIKYLFKKTNKAIKQCFIYNNQFEPALQSFEYLKRLFSMSTNKYSMQLNENTVRDQMFVSIKYIYIFQQLYEKITDHIVYLNEKQITFIRSMVWLCSISKKTTLFNDKKLQQQLLGKTLQNEYKILVGKILKYIYACLQFISPQLFQKQMFYSIITIFLPTNRYLVELIYLKAQKCSGQGYGFRYLSKKTHFIDFNCVQIIKILRKLYQNETLKNQKFICSESLDIQLELTKQNKIIVIAKSNQQQIYEGEIDNKINPIIFHYILFGIDIQKISINQLQQIIHPLMNIYCLELSTIEMKIFILKLLNIYFSDKIPTYSTPVCLKYGNINNDSKAFEMFLSASLEEFIFQYSKCMDPIIDNTIFIFNKKTLRYKIRNIMEYIEYMKQYLRLIQYYTILGIYKISRLISIVQSVLQCCSILNSYHNQQFPKIVNNLKIQKQIYIENQRLYIESILVKIIKRQTQLLDSWLLHPSQIDLLQEELSYIKKQSFKLLGIVKNEQLFNSIKSLSMVRTDSTMKYTFIKQKYFKNKQYSKIQTVKESINNLLELCKRLDSTYDQSAIKVKIQEILRSVDLIIMDLNHEFKGQKFELFNIQSIIRENGVYKQLCELILKKSKFIINFDWKNITLFLCNFIIGNPTNARLLLPCKFQDLLLGDQLDILITEIFIYAESPQEILRLEKRLYLTNDIRHKIKYFRILVTLSNKIDQDKIELVLTNKIIIIQILLRIQGFENMVKQFPESCKLGTKNPKSYDSFNEYSLQIHKVLVYLICEVSKNTPLNQFSINKWFPIEQIIQICTKPSELYWQLVKPYLYILNNTLDQLNISTINQISLSLIKNFSSQLNRTIKTLVVYDDMFNKFRVWDILDEGYLNFESHFPLKDSSNSLTLFPRKDQNYWRLFYCMQEDCIKFGLINYIISLLEYHKNVNKLSQQLIYQITQLNVLFQGMIWIYDEIERVKQQEKLEITFLFIKQDLNYAISLIQSVSSSNDIPRFIRQNQLLHRQDYLNDDQFLEEEYSATSLKPLFRNQSKTKSNPISQPTRQELRKILKRQTQMNLVESPLQLIQPSSDLSKVSIITVPIQYKWNNLVSNLNFQTISDLHFLKQFIVTFTSYFQSNYSKNLQLFLFKISQKLKSIQIIKNSQNCTEYLIFKLKIIKQILQIVYKYKNVDLLQKDFESYSLMIRNTFDFVENAQSQWRILVQVTQICTIYLSCLKDPAAQMLFLEQILNNTSNQLQRLQLVTKLFSTSMELEGCSAIQLLSHSKLCQSHYIPVIQLCLKQQLDLDNPLLPVIYQMLQVVLQFNLYVTQKLGTNIFDSQYFNLLCLLKNKIVKQKLSDNIHNLVNFTQFPSQYSSSMTQNQFNIYLLLTLITIQNVCEIVIPHNQKYLFNSFNDDFHLFYHQHLSQIEINYKGKPLNVCYPKFFNHRNLQIKDSAINIIRQQERGSFDILMKASEIVEVQNVQLSSNPRIIQFLKNYQECINVFNLISVLIATLYLLIYQTSNLKRSQFDPVSFVFLFISFSINVLNCVSSCIDYYQQSIFQQRIRFKSIKNYYRLESVLYYAFIILFSLVCFVQKYLISFLLLIMLSEKFGLKMHDTLFSLHTKKIGLIILIIFSIYITFLQFNQYFYLGPQTYFNQDTIQNFFSIGQLPSSNTPGFVIRDIIFQILSSIYIPAIFTSFLIIYKIKQMNTSNLFKCLVCQKVFNQNSFSKHQIHKLSNYMSYFSFILQRKSPLNKLQEYVRTHITNNDIGIFPE